LHKLKCGDNGSITTQIVQHNLYLIPIPMIRGWRWKFIFFIWM